MSDSMVDHTPEAQRNMASSFGSILQAQDQLSRFGGDGPEVDGRGELNRAGNIIQAYALVSGGKDSLSLAHWLAERGMLKGCVVIDTGISVPEWRDFIETTCNKQGWPFEVFAATKGPSGSWPVYEGLVERYGFPGPKMHTVFMNWLKGRGVEAFQRIHPGELLASGVRTGESARRLHSAKRWSIFVKSPVWAPLLDWSTERTLAYFRSTGMNLSPAYLTLGISGDCLCGAFAQPHERQTIATEYPQLFTRIEKLEQNIKDHQPKRCLWGWAKQKRNILPSVICVECEPSGFPESGSR